MGQSKVITSLPFQIQSSWQLSLLELPPCCVPTCNTVTSSLDSSDMYISTVQSGPPSANATLSSQSFLQTSYPLSAHFVSSSPAPSLSPLAPGCPYMVPASSSRLIPQGSPMECCRFSSKEVLELFHFRSPHPVDIICIQESNLNLSSPFHIPGFSALHSDCTHSRFGMLSRDATHASGGVVIFVRQGLSFSELFTSSLSLLDPYSDHVGVNISLNNSPSLSFPNVYPPPIRSSPMDSRTDSFSPSIFPSRNFFIPVDFNCHHPLWDSRGTLDLQGEEVFDWVISSDTLPLTNLDTPTLLHCSSGSRSSPDISFAPSSLAFSCSWEVLQNLGSYYLPILLSVPLSSVFRPIEHPLSFNFQKARWDDFAFYFDLTAFCRGILVSSSFLCRRSLYLSDTECDQIFHFFWPHQTPF